MFLTQQKNFEACGKKFAGTYHQLLTEYFDVAVEAGRFFYLFSIEPRFILVYLAWAVKDIF